MFELAEAAVQGALGAGARYADARVMLMRTETMAARNGVVEDLRQNETAGVGVRALIGSSWGFFATPALNAREARRAGEQAAALARASMSPGGPPPQLGRPPARRRQPVGKGNPAGRGDRGDQPGRRPSRRVELRHLGHREVA